MKKEIIDRIIELGGTVSVDNKEASLRDFFNNLTFNTVLYPKPEDTPWDDAEDEEPICGLNEFFHNNQDLFKKNFELFYEKLVDTFYCLNRVPRGQVFYTKTLFTPFTKGTQSYEEWAGEFDENDFKKTIAGTKMELLLIGEYYGYPSTYFICLTDPNPENPKVYSTDSDVYFDEIEYEGTLEEFFNKFISPKELKSIIKQKLAG